MYKFIILVVALLCINLRGAYFENLPTEISQPDGTILHCYASGDEFYNWLHDSDGYTIINSQVDGKFYYAQKTGKRLTASNIVFGSGQVAKSGLAKFLKDDQEVYLSKAMEFNQRVTRSGKRSKSGVLNNLTVLIKFSDQTEFPDSRQVFLDKFNSLTANESVRDYYQEVSYGQQDIVSSFYPVCQNNVNLSVTDPYPRAYYTPYHPITNPDGYTDDQEYQRRTELLRNALEQIKNQVPASLNIDNDNDGYVDNVCFVVRGPHTAWAQLLWAHRSWFSGEVEINGKTVADYTFQPENQNTVRTLCHEMFHSLGAPDLYHYTFNGIAPAGCWDIMETGFVHMGAFMKYKYGHWLSSIPAITTSGQYSLKPLTSSTKNCYKIAIPGNSEDYLLLEYRKFDASNYERNLPASGLLVYRINNYQSGNASGPPDEVYIFRENGTASVNGKIFAAAMSKGLEKVTINKYSNPALTTTSGSLINLNIYDIGLAGDSILFKVDLNGQNIAPTVSFSNIQNGDFLPNKEMTYQATATAYNGQTISSVKFYLDGNLIGTDSQAPYEVTYNNVQLGQGFHYLEAEVIDNSNKVGRQKVSFKLFNPLTPSWFDYLSNTPFHTEFNRGCLPIKFAADYNLGSTDYLVKKININIAPDPFGQPASTGVFSCQIVRVSDNNQITSTVLADFGSFTSPLNGWFEAQIDNSPTISGKVALIMDIGSYHKMGFDQNGISGHTWMIEPDRPWTDVLSRGILGAPEMGMQLVQKEVSINESQSNSKMISLISSYPNPFNNSTLLKYNISSASQLEINVYNVKGEIVKNLFSDNLNAGNHSTVFNADGLNSGVYFVQLKTQNNVINHKVLLAK